MPNTSDFLVNSHFKMPWIIWKANAQYTVASGGYSVQQISHGLPFVPLYFGSWSTGADFSTSYDLGDTTPDYAGAGQPSMALMSSANSESVNFSITNNRSSATTFYIRVMAFAPPGYGGEVSPVDYDGADFDFNSHYRYQKIIMEGLATSSVTHNLGYLPQAKIWRYDGETVSLTSDGRLTVSTLSLPSSTDQFYYHIYGDRFDGQD